MTNQDTTVDTVTTEEDTTDVVTDEGAETTEKKPSIDYEAELKSEKERREKAEKVAADLAFKNRKAKREEVEEDEPEEDKPLTAKQLQVVLAQERQSARKELQSELISDKARKLAGSESEAKYIIEIHRGRVFPEHLTLDEQLEEAYAIANRKKLITENAELKRALRSKETANNDASGTHRDAPEGTEPKLTSQDAQALRGAGFEWDGKLKLYKKLLPDKSYLYRDPKTKKTFRR